MRLAQLEADEETLANRRPRQSKMAVDDNRASAIEAALAEIEQRQQVRRAELELSQGDLVSDLLRAAATADLAGMRAYLERPRGWTVTSCKPGDEHCGAMRFP